MADIALSHGYTTVVDEADVALVSSYHWYPRHTRKTTYATTTTKGRTIDIHKLILPVPDGYQVDHRDGDGLNNRRSNLRQATRSDQQRNTRHRVHKYGYRGVAPWGPSWRAQITINGVTTYLGCYSSKEDAALAYNQRAVIAFGEFAVLNDVPMTSIPPVRGSHSIRPIARLVS